MSKALNEALKAPKTLLVHRMQKFLFAEEQKCQQDKTLRNKITLEECKIAAKYYADRIAQFSKQGARDRDTGKWHPSSISRCPRAAILKIFGASKNPIFDAANAAKGLMIFSNGDYTHLRLQILMERMGILECWEAELEHDAMNMEGHSDGVIVLDGERIVLEIKSINDRGYTELEKRGKPKDDHCLQVQCYMEMSGIERAIILYENKDKQLWKEFVVPHAKSNVQEIKSGIASMEKYRKMKKLPPRIGDSPSAEACRWCDFSHCCFNEGRCNELLKKTGGTNENTAEEKSEGNRKFRIKPRIKFGGGKSAAHSEGASVRKFLGV